MCALKVHKGLSPTLSDGQYILTFLILYLCVDYSLATIVCSQYKRSDLRSE